VVFGVCFLELDSHSHNQMFYGKELCKDMAKCLFLCPTKKKKVFVSLE